MREHQRRNGGRVPRGGAASDDFCGYASLRKRHACVPKDFGAGPSSKDAGFAGDATFVSVNQTSVSEFYACSVKIEAVEVWWFGRGIDEDIGVKDLLANCNAATIIGRLNTGFAGLHDVKTTSLANGVDKLGGHARQHRVTAWHERSGCPHAVADRGCFKCPWPIPKNDGCAAHAIKRIAQCIDCQCPVSGLLLATAAANDCPLESNSADVFPRNLNLAVAEKPCTTRKNFNAFGLCRCSEPTTKSLGDAVNPLASCVGVDAGRIARQAWVR